MTSPDRSRRLGKGLSALLGQQSATSADASTAEGKGHVAGAQSIAIARIRPNPYQPRTEFRPEDLADLEASLRTSGLLQPITVRPAPAGGGYELVAGERRLRAATRLGWIEIPALVREMDEQTLLTLALVENLQRADLNAIEEADGYQRLIDEFGLTQQEVAEAVGKDRSTVANLLRLLQLPASVRRSVAEGALSAGHARALLPLGTERAIQDLAREAIEQSLSVREVERRVREALGKGATKTAAPREDRRPAEVRRIEDVLRRRLQTDVRISLSGETKGQIAIGFYSPDDFQRVIDLLLDEGAL